RFEVANPQSNENETRSDGRRLVARQSGADCRTVSVLPGPGHKFAAGAGFGRHVPAPSAGTRPPRSSGIPLGQGRAVRQNAHPGAGCGIRPRAGKPPGDRRSAESSGSAAYSPRLAARRGRLTPHAKRASRSSSLPVPSCRVCWVTGSINSSFLFYYDSTVRVDVPRALALFPKENPDHRPNASGPKNPRQPLKLEKRGTARRQIVAVADAGAENQDAGRTLRRASRPALGGGRVRDSSPVTFSTTWSISDCITGVPGVVLGGGCGSCTCDTTSRTTSAASVSACPGGTSFSAPTRSGRAARVLSPSAQRRRQPTTVKRPIGSDALAERRQMRHR